MIKSLQQWQRRDEKSYQRKSSYKPATEIKREKTELAWTGCAEK